MNTLLKHQFSYILDISAEADEMSASQNGMCHVELVIIINSLNPELNPICYLLALLGAHHFLHVSRIRVKFLSLRLIMSYIYIYIDIYIYTYMEHLLLMFLDHTQRRTSR